MNTGLWFRTAFGLLFLCPTICVAVFSSTESGTCPNLSAGPDYALEVLPPANPLKPTKLEQAYLDSFSILKSENSCSAFFGGSESIVALNRFTRQIRLSRFDQRVGIKMTGETTIIMSAATQFTFRLFEKVEVNRNGPFYRANAFSSNGQIPQIGPFDPNTREARVTSILHELGHLIQKPGGQYLLPNDGNDPGLSWQNTQRVLSVCGDQIRSLHKSSLAAELLGVRSAISLKPSADANVSELRP